MRRPPFTTLLLATLGVGCTAYTDAPTVERSFGNALQQLRSDARHTLGLDVTGAKTAFNQLRAVLDLRDAIRKLPSTLRLDVPLFADYHSTTPLAPTERVVFRPRTPIGRILTRVRP